MVGFTAAQIVVRGCTLWAAAMTVHAAISYVTCRFQSNALPQFLVLLIFGLSQALAVVGASVALSYAAAWAMLPYASLMEHEIYAAICFISGILGLYFGAICGVIAQRQGAVLAGLPVEPLNLRQIVRFKQFTRPTLHQSDADRLYAYANTVAWAFLVIVVGVCLWHNAPNSVLLLVSAGIAVAELVAIAATSNGVSEEAMMSDANSGLFILVLFAPLGLVLRAMSRFELVDWGWPLLTAVVVGCPLAYSMLRLLPKRTDSKIGAIFLSAFFCFSGPGSLVWSALQFANGLGAPTLVADNRVKIMDKHEQQDKHGTDYSINVVPSPNFSSTGYLKLDGQTYDRLTVGGAACIRVWRGTLPLRWYTVQTCSPL